MNSGMMWLSKEPVEKRVMDAVAYYQKKYGRTPDAAFINPKLLSGNGMIVRGISVCPMRIPLSLLWIGVEDAVAGLERASQQLLETAEETLCAWDNVSSDDFDGCVGCGGACGFRTQQTVQLVMFAESEA